MQQNPNYVSYDQATLTNNSYKKEFQNSTNHGWQAQQQGSNPMIPVWYANIMVMQQNPNYVSYDQSFFPD
jgi:hypothetical protein